MLAAMPSDSNKKRKLSADQVDEDSDDAAPKGSDVKETGQDEDKMQVNEDGDKFMQVIVTRSGLSGAEAEFTR